MRIDRVALKGQVAGFLSGARPGVAGLRKVYIDRVTMQSEIYIHIG